MSKRMVNKIPKIKVVSELDRLSVKKEAKNEIAVRARLSRRRLAEVISVRRVLVAKLPKYWLMMVG